MKLLAASLVVVLGACSGGDATVHAREVVPASPAAQPTGTRDVRIPREPGAFAPSLVAIAPGAPASEISTGTQLADVDSCASCHPDIAAQWSASAHAFASFGNPSYRANIERVRQDLGNETSRHCGGCHDLPLLVDGMLTSGAPIPADDLRAHTGVSCRLCHGVQTTALDGNGSYVWSPQPIDAPALSDAASIAQHKRQVTTKLDAELCASCHRGFLSPDMNLPVHLTGVDEAGVWRGSAYAGNGMARIDAVEQQTCIDCHMERVPASRDELGADGGTVASHRFVGGHTWMAAMRGDTEQLRLTRAKLEGAASIDVAGARIVTGTSFGAWHLPADGAPVVPGTKLELDVVIRNLLVGHRFPGGLLDVQDTWVELEVTDRRGTRLASSGLAHATDSTDEDAHVLRTLVVDDEGQVLGAHEIANFRTQVATHTLAPRDAQAVRYVLDVPAHLTRDRLPLAVTARLRHRSRSLTMQADACTAARTAEGRAFLTGARATREVNLDPCKPQPITEVARVRIELGAGAHLSTARGSWRRSYEHGMALVATTVTRLDEARAVLEHALALAPDARASAMVAVQLGWVAAKHGRVDDARGWVAAARALLALAAPTQPAPAPPVLDAVLADAFVRHNRWADAVAPAEACSQRAPQNAAAWSVYARVLVAVGDHERAVTAAARGLDLSPRDPDLLRSQATALAALRDPRAPAAQAAYVRFRAPDEAPGLRIRCAHGNPRCARDRNPANARPLVVADPARRVARSDADHVQRGSVRTQD